MATRDEQHVRIFVSSPGDVDKEREIAQRVIRRLTAEFAGRIDVSGFFWEYEPKRLTKDFQEQIPPPSMFELNESALDGLVSARRSTQSSISARTVLHIPREPSTRLRMRLSRSGNAGFRTFSSTSIRPTPRSSRGLKTNASSSYDRLMRSRNLSIAWTKDV